MNYKYIIKVADKIFEIVEKDGDHKVIIPEYAAGEFEPEVFGKPVPDFDCSMFRIKDRILTIKAGDHGIDGATLCPDKIGKFDLAGGYIPHDLGYMQLEAMAADPAWIAAGWTLPEIRKLWDMVFGQELIAQADRKGGIWRRIGRAVAHICYPIVRAVGGVAHDLMKIIIIGSLIISLTGCTGCTIPGGYTPYDKEIDYTVERIAE